MTDAGQAVSSSAADHVRGQTHLRKTCLRGASGQALPLHDVAPGVLLQLSAVPCHPQQLDDADWLKLCLSLPSGQQVVVNQVREYCDWLAH